MAKAPGAFVGVSGQLWGQRNCGLDAGNTLNLSIARGGSIAVLDPEGKVVATGGDPHKGAWFMQDAEKTPSPLADLKQAVGAHLKDGLLGGLTIPAAAQPLAQAIKLGQLANAQASLATIPDSSTELGPFKKELTKRFEDLRARKLALFNELEKDAAKKWQAFKVGHSYVRCFPNSKEASEVKTKLGTLQQDASVRKNLEAQQWFGQLLSQVFGPGSIPANRPAAKPTFDAFIKKYEGTEYAELAGKLNLGTAPVKR